jgi:hypothetical protein
MPADWFATHANGPLGVPIAFGVGVPLYSDAAGVAPLVEVLHDKGLPMGTVLAFMMSVVALWLPEMILLRRVLKPRLIGTYVAGVATSIVAIGYGVMSTPALVIDHEVVVSGRVPGSDQLRALIDAPAPPSERAVGSAAWGNSIADQGSTLMASWAQWRERRVDWRVWRVLNGER